MLSFLAQAEATQDVANPDFWMSALEFLKNEGPGYALKIIMAIVIFIIGRMVASALRGSIKKVMAKRNMDPSLSGFVASLAYFAILAFTIIAVIGQFGVQTASFVAILGAAGFAVGMALQGTLANFASGVMLLLFRPFKAGDFVDAGGVMGSVKEIGIFTTTMSTPDNKMIIIPNGQIYGGVITNFNGYDTRRVDMTMGISYDANINKAMEIINDLIAKDERFLKDPAPTVAVAELADSSVNIVVRPWAKASDYWGAFFDFHKNCKEAFDAAGIEIPFPQTVVHMNKLDV